MVKAGEAGGALEVILRRLAEFKEKAQSLKRKITGAMVYPVVVILVAVGILTFIMLAVIPKFEKIFKDFNMKLPALTELLMAVSRHPVQRLLVRGSCRCCRCWSSLLLKLVRMNEGGRTRLDRFWPLVTGRRRR